MVQTAFPLWFKVEPLRPTLHQTKGSAPALDRNNSAVAAAQLATGPPPHRSFGTTAVCLSEQLKMNDTDKLVAVVVEHAT